MLPLLAFLLGFVAGLRSLTAPAVVCWAARLGWLHFAETKLAFIDRPTTLIIFTLLALAELIADKLPNAPARTDLPGLIVRIALVDYAALPLQQALAETCCLLRSSALSAPW